MPAFPTLPKLLCALTIALLCLTLPAQAETLSDRLTTYPNWHHKPTTLPAKGDLYYPDWIAGTWQLKTTLVDMTAPLAPDIVTPGFESNREFLNQPISFDVRFIAEKANRNIISGNIISGNIISGKIVSGNIISGNIISGKIVSGKIVSDRAFNGLNIAKAYLGEDLVTAVKVDPSNPNRQITILKGDRQLESTISDRATETPDANHFLTTELFQQIFRGTDRPYLNQVETTTAYRLANQTITADQVTAIYLSPSDEKYFQAGETPVALYRYKLEFSPLQTATSEANTPINATIP
jgi:hypothetical protein